VKVMILSNERPEFPYPEITGPPSQNALTSCTTSSVGTKVEPVGHGHGLVHVGWPVMASGRGNTTRRFPVRPRGLLPALRRLPGQDFSPAGLVQS
jgi:hypothetical protein